MGRPREFDAEAVLDSAGRLFWRQGYEAVNVPDLEAATGLGRGSLYNAFGDKEGLFLAALDRYVAKHGASPFQHLATADVREGVRGLLDAIIERMSDPANPPGCLLTNTSLAAGSPRIEAEVVARVRDMEVMLEEAIGRARAQGQIPSHVDVRRLARFYCAVAQSLGVMHRANGDVEALHDIARTAMEAWPASE